MPAFFSFLLVFCIGLVFGLKYDAQKTAFKKKKLEIPALIVDESHPVLENKQFTIFIMSYNNSKFCEKNLQSVLDQDYQDYRVIYVDDCSTDDTYKKVQSFVKKHKLENKFTLISNTKNRGAVANFYSTMHTCKDEEIAVLLDGDDWFAHPYVLSKLNKYYANPDVWMTYGQYLIYPSYRKESEQVINPTVCSARGIRNHTWVTSHLKTFYAGLFKRIDLKDFIYDGEYYSMASDLAFMFPMIEMADGHVYHVPEVMYIYNYDSPLCDAKNNVALQLALGDHIRTLPSYPKLDSHPSLSSVAEYTQSLADLIIFSYNRPLQLYAYLESVKKHVTHVNQMFVLYRADAPYEEGYKKLKEMFADVHFVPQSTETPCEDFSPLVLDITFNKNISQANFVLYAVDDIIVKDAIDLNLCMEALNKTHAYGFYFRLGKHVDYCYMQNFTQGIPPLVQVETDVYAWKFSSGKGDWIYPNTLDMTLYKKDDIKDDLVEKITFFNPYSMEASWAQIASNDRLGLIHESSKMVNIPINIVIPSTNRHNESYSPEELLEIFDNGKVIDISKFYQIDNISAHIDQDLEFIDRGVSW